MKTKKLAQEICQTKRNVIGLAVSAVICAVVLLTDVFISFLPQDLHIIVILVGMINLVMLPFQIDKLTDRFSNVIYAWEMAAPVVAIVTLVAVAITG